MADTVAVTPGGQTSEAKFTAVAMVLGTVLDAAGIALGTLKDSGAISGTWLPIAILVCGTLLMLVSKLGYTRSRTLVKLAALEAEGAKAVADVAPFVQKVVEALKQEQAAAAPHAPPTPPSAT